MEENSLTETCWFNILANDLLRWQLDGAFSGDYYDSTSPDGGASSAVSMDIVSDQNSMKQINERLFALRTAVPNVTKHWQQQETMILNRIFPLLSDLRRRDPITFSLIPRLLLPQ